MSDSVSVTSGSDSYSTSGSGEDGGGDSEGGGGGGSNFFGGISLTGGGGGGGGCGSGGFTIFLVFVSFFSSIFWYTKVVVLLNLTLVNLYFDLSPAALGAGGLITRETGIAFLKSPGTL